MSKGKWTKETRVKQREMIEDLRSEASRRRQETNDLVLAALEADGQLSEAQLAEITGVANSTVQNALHRLRRDGLVRKLEERRRVGRFGNLAYIYELGTEDDSLKPTPAIVVIRRHPQDVALFGEYTRAA